MAKRDWEERGKRMAEARERLGLTQDDLVTKTGIDRSTISKLENGRGGITREKALAIAPHLQIDPDDLSDVASPSLLASIRAVERHLKTFVLLAPSVEGDPTSQQVEELIQWTREASPPRAEAS